MDNQCMQSLKNNKVKKHNKKPLLVPQTIPETLQQIIIIKAILLAD